jgi:type III secretion system YscQ/HrcQ family protein
MPQPHSTPDLGSVDDASIPQTSDGTEPVAPWSWLPRYSSRQVRLEQALARWGDRRGGIPGLDWLSQAAGAEIESGRPEVVWRASGLRRPGLIASFRCPRLGTRLALGLEVPLAHAVVDRLLGHDRPFAESRLQLTPVEWGIWTYLIVRTLEEMNRALSSSDSWDLVLDRVGPDLFNPADLGSFVTLLWSVRFGDTASTVRLWLPESVADRLSDLRPGRAEGPRALLSSAPGKRPFVSSWRAEAGRVLMPRGLGRLRVGGVLPLDDSRLTGTPQSPSGLVTLLCPLSGVGECFVLEAEPVANSGGRLVRLAGSLDRQQRPREPLPTGNLPAMSPQPPSTPATPSPDAGPLDVPVTLTVELGRVNLSLDRLADLKPGDVLELGRHSREPVELTSNGRIVARGELILIDTELGVRVTHVFL